MPHVHITGYRTGFNTVVAIKAIRALTGVSLTEAMAPINSVLRGETATLELSDVQAATQLVEELTKSGALVKLHS